MLQYVINSPYNVVDGDYVVGVLQYVINSPYNVVDRDYVVGGHVFLLVVDDVSLTLDGDPACVVVSS